MSWDLEFVPQEALADPEEWFEAEREPDPERARRHGEAVAAAVPDVRLAGPFDGGYQLVTERGDLPVTVDLEGHSATMNVAYWEGVTDAVAPVVGLIAVALAEAGPFAVYDPQEGEPVMPADVERLFRAQHPHGVSIASRIAPDIASRPWHRRPGTYLTGGLVVLLVLHKTGVL